MAISKNPILKRFRGHIDKTIVVRHYSARGRTVLSAYPNMSGVVFSNAQLENQNTFKKAVAFACRVKQSWLLTSLFQSVFGKEVVVYKQAIKIYFENPEAPLSFLLQAKMQGSTVVEATYELLKHREDLVKMAENHLKKIILFPSRTLRPIKTRRHNPNGRILRHLMAH